MQCLLYETLNGSGVADINGQWQNSAARGSNAFGNGVQSLSIASRDNNGCTRVRKCSGCHGPNSTAGPRNEHHLSFKRWLRCRSTQDDPLSGRFSRNMTHVSQAPLFTGAAFTGHD